MLDVATGEEVFEAAMAMERVGKAFYEALALGSSHADVREFCRATAQAEAAHYAAFRRMREEWAKSHGPSRLAPQTAEKLRAMVKEKVQPDPQTVRKVGLHGTRREALDMAIGMERDAIQFYQELLGLLPHLDREIQPILHEENAHLSSLLSLGTWPGKAGPLDARALNS